MSQNDGETALIVREDGSQSRAFDVGVHSVILGRELKPWGAGQCGKCSRQGNPTATQAAVKAVGREIRQFRTSWHQPG